LLLEEAWLWEQCDAADPDGGPSFKAKLCHGDLWRLEIVARKLMQRGRRWSRG
jgi:hypothetical protein